MHTNIHQNIATNNPCTITQKVETYSKMNLFISRVLCLSVSLPLYSPFFYLSSLSLLISSLSLSLFLYLLFISLSLSLSLSPSLPLSHSFYLAINLSRYLGSIENKYYAVHVLTSFGSYFIHGSL